MALAKYFDKSLLAGSAVLQGFDPTAFATMLEQHVVGLTWGEEAANSSEGRTALYLAIELLARLYPALALAPADDQAAAMAPALGALAREINSEIKLVDGPAATTVCLCVGEAAPSFPAGVTTFYIGSDGWVAQFSSHGPLSVGSSTNPLGAAAAACIGAANVFRHVFREQLEVGEPDGEVRFSLLSLDPLEPDPANPPLQPIEIGETFLVGVGAVGNAAAWILARVPDLSGILNLIDGETLDETNPQRYTGTREVDAGRAKVDIAADHFRTEGLHIVKQPVTWGRFLKARGDWRLDRVLVALDSALDRIHVQGALPRWITNAWTQPGDIGVSRHAFDDESPCLACLYLPSGVVPSEDQVVADTLRLQGQPALMRVRALLYDGSPVGEDFAREAAAAMGIDPEALLPFAEMPLRMLYREALCSGIVLRLGGHAGAPLAEVPLAFQSAMAGILLAAELVADAGGLRPAPLPATTRMDLLRPLGTVLAVPQRKSGSGTCICEDEDYTGRYREKYPDLSPILSDR
jgi:hypothetical protein